MHKCVSMVGVPMGYDFLYMNNKYETTMRRSDFSVWAEENFTVDSLARLIINSTPEDKKEAKNLRILHFVLGDSSQNLDIETKFFGKKVYLKRLGVHYDEELLKSLALKLNSHFDVVAFSGLGHTFKVGNKEVSHYLLNEVRSLCNPTPVVDGQELRKLTLPWSLNHFVKVKVNLFSNKKIGFFSGLLNQSVISMVSVLVGDCLLLILILSQSPLGLKEKSR